MSFFKVDKLTRKFGGLIAVNDVSFEIEKGMIYSIIGPNGAGKTTLFNCISGLYPPTSGDIHFFGDRISGLKPHQVAGKGIARTFQNLELFANVSTMENLLLGRHLHLRSGLLSGFFLAGKRSPAAKEEVHHRRIVEQIIDRLDLQAVRDRPVSTLPYGVQKRIELGRALAMEPQLLLLDEPSAGMNTEERQDLIYWIQDIRDELGITILMIEHHMQLVMSISDQILALNFGRVLTEGSPEDVAAHPEVIRAYLGDTEDA